MARVFLVQLVRDEFSCDNNQKDATVTESEIKIFNGMTRKR